MSEFTLPEARQFVKQLLGNDINDLHLEVFELAWEGETYEEMSPKKNRVADSLKNTGSELWQKLTLRLGNRVTKRNFKSLLEEEYKKKSNFFYIQRNPDENNCYQRLLQKASFIRISASRQMGKTLLFNKLLGLAKDNDYSIVHLDFSGLSQSILSDYEKLANWFCGKISQQLKLRYKKDDYFQEWNSTNDNIQEYLELYILTNISQDIVLACDHLDTIFELPNQTIINDFCNLFRTLSTQATGVNAENWKRLHFILSHSTEKYVNFDMNYSPLEGVGFVMKLRGFNIQEVKQYANHFQIPVQDEQINKLQKITGGHPYLIFQFFEKLSYFKMMSFDELLSKYADDDSPFKGHLGKLLEILENQQLLFNAYKEILSSQQPIPLESHISYKLDCLGLVKMENNNYQSSCPLYQDYFSRILQ